MICAYCRVRSAMATYSLAPRQPYGKCDTCGMYARIWRYGESLIDFGIGYGVVDGHSICRICLAQTIVTIERSGHNTHDLGDL
jgi:hypothetical protein